MAGAVSGFALPATGKATWKPHFVASNVMRFPRGQKGGGEMSDMQESKLTTKGRTTLPRDVRVALSLQTGDTLRYLLLDGEVRITKTRPVAELRGLLGRSRREPVTLEEMEDAISARATE